MPTIHILSTNITTMTHQSTLPALANPYYKSLSLHEFENNISLEPYTRVEITKEGSRFSLPTFYVLKNRFNDYILCNSLEDWIENNGCPFNYYHLLNRYIAYQTALDHLTTVMSLQVDANMCTVEEASIFISDFEKRYVRSNPNLCVIMDIVYAQEGRLDRHLQKLAPSKSDKIKGGLGLLSLIIGIAWLVSQPILAFIEVMKPDTCASLSALKITVTENTRCTK